MAHDGCDLLGARRHEDDVLRPVDRGRVRERKSSPVEDAHRRRMEDRRAEDDLGERVLGVLARLPAAGEERLQRLCGELDHPVAVDPARPAPLELASAGENMQSFTAVGSVCTTSRRRSPGAERGSAPRSRSARACASASAARGSRPQREVRDETFVGVQEPQLLRVARRRRLAHDRAHRRGVAGDLGGAGGLGQRLEVRLHGARPRGRRRRSRARPARRSRARPLEREVAGQLECSDSSVPAVDREDAHVVHLAHARHARAPRRARARARPPPRAARHGRRRRLPAARPGRRPRPRPPPHGPARRRRRGAMPITTSANWRPAGLAHPQAAELDGRRDAR